MPASTCTETWTPQTHTFCAAVSATCSNSSSSSVPTSTPSTRLLCSPGLASRTHSHFSTPVQPRIGMRKEDQIAYLDAEVARTEESIVCLVRQRAMLKRKRNAHFPAVNLPPELLSLIFEFASLPTPDDESAQQIQAQDPHVYGSARTPQSYTQSHSQSQQTRRRRLGSSNLGIGVGQGALTPFFFGTICSRWRDIAFGSSQLWNSVIINLNERHAPSQAWLLKKWLSKAGKRPLKIKVVEDEATSMDLDDEDDDWETSSSDDEIFGYEDGASQTATSQAYPNASTSSSSRRRTATSRRKGNSSWGIDVNSTAVIDVLAAYSDQWHTVDLFLPSTWKPTLTRIRHRLSRLTTLTLRIAQGSPTFSRVDVFACAHNLRNVTLIGLSVSDVVLPWTTLQSIDMDYFSINETLELLQACPSLRQCQFTQQVQGTVPFVATSVRHDLLSSFELILDNSVEIRSLFRTLVLPNLKQLVLSVADNQPILEPAMDLLTRSGCLESLKRLHLVGATPHEDELLCSLRQLVGLEALLLINPSLRRAGRTWVGNALTDKVLDGLTLKTAASRRGGSGVDDQGDVEMQPTQETIVPKLQVLEYQGAIAFSPHTLVQMLSSRCTRESDSDPSAPSLQYGCSPQTPDSELEFRHAQLRSAIFTMERQLKFAEQDTKILRNLVAGGMHLAFLMDSCGG